MRQWGWMTNSFLQAIPSARTTEGLGLGGPALSHDKTGKALTARGVNSKGRQEGKGIVVCPGVKDLEKKNEVPSFLFHCHLKTLAGPNGVNLLKPFICKMGRCHPPTLLCIL